MKKISCVVLAILLSNNVLFAENGPQYFELKKAFETPLFQKKLGSKISFDFGTGSKESILASGFRAHQKAKGATKNPEKACQEALFKTLLRFQKRAIKMGGTKVVNLKGHYYKQDYDSKEKFQCWISDNIAGVLLIGDVAK